MATPHPLPAGTITASALGRKIVLCPAPLASRKTNAADITGSTCLRHYGRPPLHHRQTNQTAVPGRCLDLCIYPHRLVPRCKERTNYDLCTANGTSIHTYGWLPLSLNLGLRREFTWRFVVTDVTDPIIGAFRSPGGLSEQPHSGQGHVAVSPGLSGQRTDPQRKDHQ
jgi:hypothetical protein